MFVSWAYRHRNIADFFFCQGAAQIRGERDTPGYFGEQQEFTNMAVFIVSLRKKNYKYHSKEGDGGTVELML